MLRIAVVDDSVIIRRNISKMLERMGHTIVGEAKDGKEAITCYLKNVPDLMTMDITMADMDGIEAVKEIKQTYNSAKIIMVTSHGQEEMVISAIKAGASGYVLKPITADNLAKAIRKIYPDNKPLETNAPLVEEVPAADEGDWLQDLEDLSL